MKTDRRELNTAEKAECAALKAEIAARNASSDGRKKLTQEYLAQELGMTQGNLSSHLNGKRPISKEMAAKMAVLLGIPVERFSERLAKEIAEMAEAVMPRASSESIGEQAATYQQAKRAAAMMDFATPRTRSVLERINQAALAGRLTDADLDLLDQIAARFESSEGEQHASQQGSNQRLREKLQKNDPHTR